MKVRQFWAGYLAVVALILGGVYVATASFDGLPAFLSVSDMQQLKGATWRNDQHCEWTDGCPVMTCDVNTGSYISTQSYRVQQCFDYTGSECQDDAGEENVHSCDTWVYDSNCNNPTGPTPTNVYQCEDNP